MKKRYYIVIAALLFGASVAKAQDHIKLDLQKTIQLANDSSLEAFRTQNMYLSGYWEYRTYKANRLPSLTLNMTPAEYNRDITKRYDSEKDLDVYRSQQSFYASGNLAIQQNFDLTGGTFIWQFGMQLQEYCLILLCCSPLFYLHAVCFLSRCF